MKGNDLGKVLDMAYTLDLVPVETNMTDRTLLVLGINGNLFKLTFENIRKIYIYIFYFR